MEAANAVARGLGSPTLVQSAKHWYGGLPQLQMLASGMGQSYPFRRTEPVELRAQRYEPGALPGTDDVLSRSVALTVGLSDTYTGAHFGVNVFSGPEEVRAVAEKFNATLDEVLG